MNCHRIKRSGRPASWLHSRFCAECRDSQRADDLLAFGIVQLRKPIHAHTPLNATLAALKLRPLPENHARIRRQRRRARAWQVMSTTAAMSVFGWFTYMNWTPAEPRVPVTQMEQDPTPGYNALAAANKAITSESATLLGDIKISGDISKLEMSPPGSWSFLPSKEADSVGHFVRVNARALDQIHADLTTPYHENLPRTLRDMNEGHLFLNNIMITLRADAAFKRYEGDRAGALAEAMHLMTFGENVSGGGSLLSRFTGKASQYCGRRLIWRLLPEMSASEALRCCRALEALHRQHVPLQATVRWERDAGLAVRRDLLSDPLWRWRAVHSLFNTDAPALNVTLMLYRDSNRRIVQDYLSYMDVVEQDLNRPYPLSRLSTLSEPTDLVNRIMTIDYTNVRFTDTAADTQNALLTAALALHAYRLRTGAYPPSLNALCPIYLAQVPSDPFQAGGSLHYAPTRKRVPFFDTLPPLGKQLTYPPYLLYSVGPDGTDQHGTPILSGNPTNYPAETRDLTPHPGSQGDIVAGINL